MTEFLGPLVLAAVGVIAALLRCTRVEKEWTAAATTLGLGLEYRFLRPSQIRGMREGFWIEVKKEDKVYEGIVEGPGQLPLDLELGAESPMTRGQAPDISTGDSAFDHQTRITGSEPIALAVLDRETRPLVTRDVVQRGAEVEGGSISIQDRRLGVVVDAIPRLVDLAKHLVVSEDDIPHRLARNVNRDPNRSVRLRNLRQLTGHYRGHDVTLEVCRRALDSSDPVLRLEAGIGLGEEGVKTVSALARDERGAIDLRVRAVEHLCRASWAETSIPLLEELLEVAPLRVQRAVIVGLGRYRHRGAMAPMQALASAADSRTLELIAKAMGRIGDAHAEPTLVSMLSHSDKQVRTAATRALGRAGTTAAVEPLLELQRGVLPTDLKGAAGEAIDRIQSRVAGAEHGQLSMAAPPEPEGAVSLAEDSDEAGALSLSDSEGH